MNKEEKEIKDDIARRLRLSDEILWDSLPDDMKSWSVDKYYTMGSIKNVGVHKVLEDNRDIRRNLGSILIGLMLGLFGGVTSDVVLKYLPKSGYFDLFIVIVFLAILILFVRMIERASVDHLKEDHVLEYLVESIAKDDSL